MPMTSPHKDYEKTVRAVHRGKISMPFWELPGIPICQRISQANAWLWALEWVQNLLQARHGLPSSRGHGPKCARFATWHPASFLAYAPGLGTFQVKNASFKAVVFFYLGHLGVNSLSCSLSDCLLTTSRYKHHTAFTHTLCPTDVMVLCKVVYCICRICRVDSHQGFENTQHRHCHRFEWCISWIWMGWPFDVCAEVCFATCKQEVCVAEWNLGKNTLNWRGPEAGGCWCVFWPFRCCP